LNINENDCVIEWDKDRKLTWDDFKGKVPKSNRGMGAIAATGVYKYYYYSKRKVSIKIVAIFDCNISWNSNNNDYEGLIHEQGHFDIAEIFARRLRKELNSIRIMKNDGHIIKIEKIIYNYEEQRKDYNKLYDKETKHSFHKEKQKEWNERIARELEELEKYKNPVIKIRLR